MALLKNKREYRLFTLFSLAIFLLFSIYITQAYSQFPPKGGFANKARLKIEIKRNVMVKTRDGVKLATDIFLPRKKGKFPVVLARIPYGKQQSGPILLAAKALAHKGMAVVLQDCRGRYDSKGKFYPFIHEVNDSADTIRWIKRQSWAGKKLGLIGFSYLGYTAWAGAVGANSKVDAMVPITATMSPYRILYERGVLNYSLALDWSIMVDGKINNSTTEYNWFRPVTAPLNEIDDVLYKDNAPYDSWLDHPTPDNYWSKIDLFAKGTRCNIPTLFIGGWYDIFAKSTLDEFVKVTAGGGGKAKDSVLIMGPWSHSLRKQTGEINFGSGAGFEMIFQAMFTWLQKYLGEEGENIPDPPKIMLFVMGENKWRMEGEWPLARTRFKKMYFHSDNKNESPNSSGALTWFAPGDEKYHEFYFDPKYPVPTVGGNFYPPQYAGPKNQSALEKREDVLIFTSEPLKEEMEITGPISVTLYASTSAKDTDFTAKLVSVERDGRAINLVDGIVRARYGKAVKNPPSFVEPGEVVKYTIDLWATSYLFSKGQRLRVEISSSNFPRFDVNRNTGGNFATDNNYVIAHQKIYHNGKYPSHITLPVIPRY